MKMKFPLGFLSQSKNDANEPIVNTQNIQPPSNSPVTIGFWYWELKTNKTVLSESLYKIFDMDSHSRARGSEDVWRMIHPDDKQRIDELFEDIRMNQIHSKEFECRIITPSDQIRYLSTRVEVTFNSEGVMYSLNALVEDITNYRNAMKQWSFMKRSFDTFIANSSDAIVFLDTKIRVTRMNAAA